MIWNKMLIDWSISIWTNTLGIYRWYINLRKRERGEREIEKEKEKEGERERERDSKIVGRERKKERVGDSLLRSNFVISKWKPI